MRSRISFAAIFFLLPLALFQYTCGRQAEPPPPPPPPPSAAAPVASASQPSAAPGEKTSSIEQLHSHLKVKWEDGAAAKLVIELGIENAGTSPVHLGFSNSGRVCGVVLDSEATAGDTAASKGPRGSKGEGAKGYRFPQMTAQVMGEETFAPGQTRTFRYEVRRAELGEPLVSSYTVEAWICGYEKLRQRATVEISGGK